MPHKRGSKGRPLPAGEKLPRRAAAIRRVQTDHAVTNFNELAASMGWSRERLFDILGPEKRRISYTFGTRRDGERPRRDDWRTFTKKGQRKRQTEAEMRELESIPTEQELRVQREADDLYEEMKSELEASRA